MSELSPYQYPPKPKDTMFYQGTLIILGVLGLLCGILLNQWTVYYYPAPVYIGVSVCCLALVLALRIWPQIEENFFDYTSLCYLLQYLSLVFFTFQNSFDIHFSLVLIAAHILFSLSFKSFTEFIIFALASISLLLLCSHMVVATLVDRPTFLIVISLSTISAGLYVWRREYFFQLESRKEEMLRDLMNTSEQAIFLLDQQCTRILFRNLKANSFLMVLHGKQKITAHQLLFLLGLDPLYVSNQFRHAAPDYKVNGTYLVEDTANKELFIQTSIQRLRSPQGPALMIRLEDVSQHKQEERQRNKQSQLNETVINALLDMLFVIDAQGVIKSIYKGNKFSPRFELKPFIGMHFASVIAELMSEGHAQESKAALEHVLLASEPQEFVFQTRKGQVTRFYHVNLFPFAIEGGEVLAMIQDITHTRKRQAPFLASPATTLPQTQTGIIITDSHSLLPLEINQPVIELLGYTQEEIGKLSVNELSAPSSQEVSQALDLALQGIPQRIRSNFVRKDQTQIELELGIRKIYLHGRVHLMFLFAQPGHLHTERQLPENLASMGNLAEAVITVSPELLIQSWSPTACALYGWNSHEVLNRHLDQVLPGFWGNHGLEEVWDELSISGIWRSQLSHYHRNGSKLEVLCDAYWVNPVQGEKFLVFVLQDLAFSLPPIRIPQQDSLNFYALFQRSPHAICIQNHEGIILEANPTACQLFQLSSEDLSHIHFESLVLTSELLRFQEDYLELRAENRSFISTVLEVENGSLPVEIRLSNIFWNKSEAYALYLNDMRPHQQAQYALRQSEKKYRTLIEKMNEGLLMTDLHDNILFANDQISTITGFSKTEILKRKASELLAGPKSENTGLLLQKNQLRAQGISDQYELALQRHDKSLIWVLVNGSPNIDSEGNIIGTIAIITDITARKLTELKLQEKNQELDAFVYKASHDLKGPLASIIGILNIARQEVGHEEAQRYFDLITKSTLRLDMILTDLIDVTRINKADLQYEAIDIGHLVEEVIDSLRHIPESKHIQIQKEVHYDQPLNSDKKLLTSILQNLIGNAINYHDPKKDQQWIKISVTEQEGRIDFAIRDNGLGIPEKIQKRVFEMFFRGNTKSKGSGLGLYIVKSSIEKLHGVFQLESEPGRGTHFSFSLPLTHDSFDLSTPYLQQKNQV